MRVVSASFGRAGSASQLEIAAINGTLRSAGILLMAAAGNSEPWALRPRGQGRHDSGACITHMHGARLMRTARSCVAICWLNLRLPRFLTSELLVMPSPRPMQAR